MFREYLHRTYQGLIRGRKPRSRTVFRTGRPEAARLTIEGLEDRTLLSTLTLLFNGNVVYAPATSVNNSLSISENPATQYYTVVDTNENITLQGPFINPSGNGTHTVSFWYGNIGWFTVNMGNQNFTVNIEQTLGGIPVYVNLGNGTDAVNVSPAAHNLDHIQGAINVQAGAGSDSLNVYDQSNAAAHTFSLGTGSLSRSGAAPITYTAGSLSIYGGNGANTYNVSNTQANYATNLNTGNGQDTVNVDGAGSGGTFTTNEGSGGVDVNLGATAHKLDNLHGTININGNQLGVDNLTVDDQVNSASATFTLNSNLNTNSITRSGAGLIQYNNLLNNVFLLTGTGGATVNVLATRAPTSIVGHASGTVNVGNAGSVQQILDPLTITDPPSGAFVTLNVDDSADSATPTVILDTNVIGGSTYGRITGLAPAPIQYKYADTSIVSVDTGTGGAMVNLLATGVPVNLTGHGPNSINVGNAGSVQAINGPIAILGSPSSVATVNMNDSADGTARAVTLYTLMSSLGRIAGLAPAYIQYSYANTSTVTIQTGTGGATVNALATGVPVNVMGHGSNTVNVGNAGSVQAINGPLTISGSPSSLATVNVEDSANANSYTVTLDAVVIGGANYGRITGLAPAAILYRYADTNTISIQTSAAGDLVNVLATNAPVNLIGHGSNWVNVGNTGSVQAINGPLTVSGSPVAQMALNVDDSFDSVARSGVTLDRVTIGGSDYGRITGLAPAAIQYKYSDFYGVGVETGSGGATVNVLATGAWVNLIGNSSNTVNVGSAGNVQAINGLLTISGPPLSLAVNVNDSTDSIPRTVTLDTVVIGGANCGRITGLAPAAIEYVHADTNTVTVQTGTGGGTVNVLATGVPVSLTGSGSETVNVGNAGSVQAINAALTIGGFSSPATVNVDDSADGTPSTVTLDTVTIGGGSFGRITGLAPAVIEYNHANTSTVTIQTGTGGAMVNPVTTGVPLNLIGNPSGLICLVASDADNSWTITGQNAGTLSSALLAGAVTFSGAANLLGGNGADTFVFADGAGVDGTIDGGGGTNALDYSAYSTSVVVNLQTGAATGVGAGFANIQNVAGGSAANTLTGPDAATTWSVTGADAGTLNNGVTFAAFGNLIGGAGDNAFVFADGATLSGSVTGGGGTNTLDYSAYSTSVLVNLQTGFGTGVGGSIANIQNVTGGTGGGAGVYNILVGNGGNVLTGGDGRRNLLIAGASASTLVGGNDDDILIGGTTVYDTQAGMVSLQALMAYWSSTTDDYATRVANLLNGTGCPRLDNTIAHSNGGGNTLMGNNGGAGEMNLFFGLDPTQETTDYNPAIGEQFINC
jgi:hypothetical protein